MNKGRTLKKYNVFKNGVQINRELTRKQIYEEYSIFPDQVSGSMNKNKAIKSYTFSISETQEERERPKTPIMILLGKYMEENDVILTEVAYDIGYNDGYVRSYFNIDMTPLGLEYQLIKYLAKHGVDVMKVLLSE